MDISNFPDPNYTYAFHSPGEEPWICGLLRKRRINRVLDLGCGLGIWGFLIRTYVSPDAQITGLDISAETLKRIQKLHLYDNVILSDATTIELTDVFDAILLVEFLHGLKDQDKFLEKLEGKLAKNGILIVAGPSDLKMRKTLRQRNYSIYEYYLRGFFLIDAQTGKSKLMRKSKAIKILAMLLGFARKISYKKDTLHIIAFKEAS
jgi:2-polyprenyl-3-methyl-5-hydroxy-6-metoxy-1,4-benzoquinol methylase